MKRRVYYEIFKDMQKYIMDFNPDDYEKVINMEDTDISVIDYVKKYYLSHFPIDLKAWERVNMPDENVPQKECFYDQISFIERAVGMLITESCLEYVNGTAQVISTHELNSVILPVFKLNLKNPNVEFIIESDSSFWKISVNSDIPLDIDFLSLFDPKGIILPIMCKGIPRDKVYGSYDSNHSKFTCLIYSKYEVYTFFYLIKHYLKNERKS